MYKYIIKYKTPEGRNCRWLQYADNKEEAKKVFLQTHPNCTVKKVGKL